MRNEPETGKAATRTGFDTNFLAMPINLPAHRTDIAEDLVQLDGSPVIDYTHFSLALRQSRKFARCVGWNIDGTQMQLLSRTGINFTTAPRIPAEDQAGNDLYANNRLDRGHPASRADLIWGPDTEAHQANKDSFYFTRVC